MYRPFIPLENANPEIVTLIKTVKEEYPQGMMYTPGGSGYILNWHYIKLLTESLDSDFCLPEQLVPDDWAISFCMHHYGITPKDTRDALQRERFHQYTPKRIYHQIYDDQDYNHQYFKSVYSDNNWFTDHNGIGWKNEEMCAAPDSISFHYVKGNLMYLFHDYFYNGGKEEDLKQQKK